MKGKMHLETPEMRDLSDKLIHAISGTQLYSVYKDKNQSLFKLWFICFILYIKLVLKLY